MATQDSGSEELWERLERTAQTFAPASPTSAKPPVAEGEAADKEAKKKRRRTVRRRLDAIAWIFWPYAVLKLFVVDLDRKMLEVVSEDYGRLVDYRAFVYLAILIVLASTIKKSWMYVLYIIFFPLIVLLWKIPRLVHRRRSWLLVVGIVHVCSTLITAFRYNVITKGLAIFAVIVATIPKSPYLLIPGCLYLVVLLLVSYYRAVRHAFSRSRFLQQQDRLINFLLQKKPMNIDEVATELRGQQLELYPKADLDKFTNALNFHVAVNRGLYFWAYQLDQYRQTPVSLAMNGIAYFGLFLGSAAAVTTVNIGILHLDPSQFNYDSAPSVLAMAVYSTASLALNAAGGVEAAGDWANVVRLSAGVLGVAFLLSLLANIGLAYRRERDDSAIRETVKRLKRRAVQQERDLKKVLDVDIEEALRRLDRLGANLGGLIVSLMAHIPAEFFEDET